MSLNDVQHVEAVAIVRRLAEESRALGPGLVEAVCAAEQWLRENHPAPEVYVAAVSGVARQIERFPDHEDVNELGALGQRLAELGARAGTGRGRAVSRSGPATLVGGPYCGAVVAARDEGEWIGVVPAVRRRDTVGASVRVVARGGLLYRRVDGGYRFVGYSHERCERCGTISARVCATPCVWCEADKVVSQ